MIRTPIAERRIQGSLCR